jgi:hypothetical protein
MNCPRCESPMIFKELTNDHVGWCCYSCEVFIDPKVEDANRERQILAEAARGESWRVNKETEAWFAEKPCPKIGLPESEIWNRCYECGDESLHCKHCCNGTLFVRAGRKR